MQKTAPEAATGSSSEQRRLARKNVLLSGVIAEANGESASECLIRDIHAQGAAVSVLKPLQVGARVFLLDAANGVAHDARVAWTRAGRSGLSFNRSYTMGLGLPPSLKFLWRLLFEAKLRQAERAIATGVAAKLALSTAGLNREYIYQMSRHASSDKRFQQVLLRARRLLGD